MNWLAHYLSESVDEAQELATKWSWTDNHEITKARIWSSAALPWSRNWPLRFSLYF